MIARIKAFVKNNWVTISFILFLGVYIIIADMIGISCPFRSVLGITCAGCGMTRAWEAVLHLDFAAAFNYHPAFWVVPVVGGFWLFQKKIPRIANVVFYAGIGIMLAVYVYRLFDPNDTVVYFEPSKGLIARLARKSAELLRQLITK